MISRWTGTNSSGLENLRSDDALEVYSCFLERAEVFEVTTRDYEAGTIVDLDIGKKTIEEGIRIAVPLPLAHSVEVLPKRATKPILEVWGQPWSEGLHLITEWPIGDGVGHLLPKEAPRETDEAVKM